MRSSKDAARFAGRVALSAVCIGVFGMARAEEAKTAGTFQVGSCQAEVGGDGRFRLAMNGQELIRDVRLVVAAPQWKGGGDQKQAHIAAGYPRREGEAVTIQGEIREPISAARWKFTEQLRVVGGAVWVAYELQALAATEAGEVSLFFDLPIAVWHGKKLLLWPMTGGTFPEAQPAERHFLTGLVRTLVCGVGERSQLTVRFTPARNCTVQDTREWKQDIYQAYVRLHGGGRVRAGEKLRLEFELRPNDPAEFVSPTVELSSRKPLTIQEVVKSAETVPRFGRLTIRADITATFDTPFDPDQIAVDAHFTPPSGKTLVVPAFFTQDYAPKIEGGIEWFGPKGPPAWEVRFAPVETGAYKFHLTARDRSGTVRSTKETFRCVPSHSPGCVRVSKSDPRYFEFDNGQAYFAIGENTATPASPAAKLVSLGGVADFNRWFSRLGKAGANYTRVWMCSPSLGIEWGKPGTYRLDHAWQLDRVMKSAERRGIYVKLCLESWRGFAGPGSFVRGNDVHPYWKKNGGPCDKEIEVFTNAEAKRMFRNRLRYVVARWGHSTHLLAWEFWNEINCVRGYDADIVAAWPQEMARYVKSIDPWQHLIVNSLGSFLVDERYWRLPEMDFAQVHGYWHPTAKESRETGKDMAQFAASWVEQLRPFGKPALFAEFGLVNDRWGPSPLAQKDREGVHLHNGLWSAMMSGACGTAMLWWWDSYVGPLDLYWQFHNVAAFARDVPWTTAGFEPFTIATSDPSLCVRGLRGTKRNLVLLWLQNKNHTWWNVVEGASISEARGAELELTGVDDGRWRVEWWDTWRGKRTRSETITAAEDKLVLNISPVARDQAVRLSQVERREQGR